MDMTCQDLMQRLQIFSQKTLEWCSQEAEQSNSQVTSAIDLLLENATRVSQISSESLAAIQGMQTAIQVSLNDKTKLTIGSLLENLEQLAKQHKDVESVISPVIQALQFQDRLRQNLENMVKMLPIWMSFRETLPETIAEQHLHDFAHQLMQVSTMKSERDIVRRFIAGLPAEADVTPVLLF
ncbi:MAG: hypothetical protein NTX25_00655 [Proteobacteria bacterium]|nr:hypothetical protein [Pseudomonadota bacterium]